MPRQASLGEFEQLVMLAALRLGEDASGNAISTELEEKADRSVSRGALYSALDRLEYKGFLTWRVEASTPERGGHPSRIFSVTEDGLEALREHQRAIRNLAEGLDAVLDPGGSQGT
ncbi:MAG: PadR family transcriptional regulator [Gemmatimonadota bacterium]|jgi:DNA-binding PadR family transcriptional regulator